MSFVKICAVVTYMVFIYYPSLVFSDSPNIIYILLDDIGNSDISSTGSEYSTPNIDELYSSSIVLNSHYIGLLCSPSRSQILTGRYAWSFGLSALQPFGYQQISAMPSGVPTIGNLLKEYTDYSTYVVGKWHVGYVTTNHTPIERGFDNFYGFLMTGIFYSNKTATDPFVSPYYYLDWWNNNNPDYETQYTFSTYSSRDRIVEIINDHSNGGGSLPDVPFYIYAAFQVPHNDPLQLVSSAHQSECDSLMSIDYNRYIYCLNILALDESIGEIISELEDNGLWDNTLIVFTSDNGGMYGPGGCNYPYRGDKSSYFDGGIKTIAFIGGGYVNKNQRGTQRDGLMHGADWTPTLLSIAGADENKRREINLRKRLEEINRMDKTINKNKNDVKNTNRNVSGDGVSDSEKEKTEEEAEGEETEKGEAARIARARLYEEYDDYEYSINGLTADTTVFDGIDLSEWLLYGNEDDNPRTSVGLSINEWNTTSDIAIVFISNITGHRYKFFNSTTTFSGNWCNYCENKDGTTSRCQISGSRSGGEGLFDLTIDFNETTNLKTSGDDNLKNKNKNKNKETIDNNENENENEAEYVAIHNISDYFINGDPSVPSNLVNRLWNEGISVVNEYINDNIYFNQYLSCQTKFYGSDSNPADFGGVWSPYYDFDTYADTFRSACHANINTRLLSLYTHTYDGSN